MIKVDGIIVVEGKDDKTALSRVLDANIFVLNGMTGTNNKKIDDLKKIAKNNKIYLLTDPDFAGIKIREKINKNIDGVINLYSKRFKATKNGNIGIENLSDEDILEIFKNLPENEYTGKKEIFNMTDLINAKLTIDKNSSLRREVLGDLLGISYSNSKQFLNKLNSINISKEEFMENVNKIDELMKLKDKNAAIFGKFFPIHNGHIWFIKEVSRYCKKLYVFVCGETQRDEKLNSISKLPKMSIKDRKNFVIQELKGYKNIEVVELNEDGIEEYPNGWLNWSKRVQEKLEEKEIHLEVVFTNELQDKENYSKYLSLDAVLIDPSRNEFNVSATKIRENPEKYYDFIPQSVKKWIKGGLHGKDRNLFPSR